MEKLSGDPQGIQALKDMAQTHRDYLKFLLVECQTSIDHRAPFTGPDGVNYVLQLMAGGEMQVSRAS